MKRCDLHIHTVPSVSDRMFTYDKDVLLDYVAKTKLDVIAITNHNLFDYAQYQEIKDALIWIFRTYLLSLGAVASCCRVTVTIPFWELL